MARLIEKGGLLEGWTWEYVLKEAMLGVSIGFAQVPESVAFAFLANVKPPIALHAAWMVGLICSIFGGRPGMVNGATGAFAAIIATFLPEPVVQGGNGAGVELLFPFVILGGVLMFCIGFLKLSRFILLLPSPVMIGFCNGLAIVIGLAQLHPFQNADTHEWKTGSELYWMMAITLVSMITMEFLPKVPFKIFQVIPSSLMAIILAITIEFAIVRPSGARTDTIGDVSKFTSDDALPVPFFIGHNPFSNKPIDYDLSKITRDWNAIKTVLVQGLLLATVGSIESLMTSEVVESYVKTPSDGQKTLFAMGAANTISGCFGGMGGNAMIGLSTINVLGGGRGRLAPICTALVVMASIMGAYPVLNFIPVAALAGVMIVVVLHTFKWFSLTMLLNMLPMRIRACLGPKYSTRKIPRVEVVVIVTVTLMSIFLNIAYAVGAGIAICAIAFAWDAGSQLEVKIPEMPSEEGKKIYQIEGLLFFTSANRLAKVLDVDGDPDKVEIWFGSSSLMDYTAIATLHKVAEEYKAKNKEVVFKSLNMSSQKIIEKANDLVASIEWTAAEESIPKVPDITAGWHTMSRAEA
jgi:SulP family sulfate permease